MIIKWELHSFYTHQSRKVVDTFNKKVSMNAFRKWAINHVLTNKLKIKLWKISFVLRFNVLTDKIIYILFYTYFFITTYYIYIILFKFYKFSIYNIIHICKHFFFSIADIIILCSIILFLGHFVYIFRGISYEYTRLCFAY